MSATKQPSTARRLLVGMGSILLLSGALPAWGWSQGWDWDEDFTPIKPDPVVDCELEAAPTCDTVWS